MIWLDDPALEAPVHLQQELVSRKCLMCPDCRAAPVRLEDLGGRVICQDCLAGPEVLGDLPLYLNYAVREIVIEQCQFPA